MAKNPSVPIPDMAALQTFLRQQGAMFRVFQDAERTIAGIQSLEGHVKELDSLKGELQKTVDGLKDDVLKETKRRDSAKDRVSKRIAELDGKLQTAETAHVQRMEAMHVEFKERCSELDVLLEEAKKAHEEKMTAMKDAEKDLHDRLDTLESKRDELRRELERV